MSEEQFDRVEGRLDGLEGKVDVLQADVTVLKTDVVVLKSDVAGLKTEVVDLRRYVGVLHEDVIDRIKAIPDWSVELRREMREGFAEMREANSRRFEPLEV